MRFIDAEQVIIRKGSEVAFYTEESGVDIGTLGRVTDRHPVDGIGNRWDELVEVTWEDGGIDIMGLNQLMLVVR